MTYDPIQVMKKIAIKHRDMDVLTRSMFFQKIFGIGKRQWTIPFGRN